MRGMDATTPFERLDDRDIPMTGTDALVDLASKMGLDSNVVRTALETRRYRGTTAQESMAAATAAPATDADERSAEPLPHAVIPAIVVDGRYAVIGSRGDDVLLGVLWQAQLDSAAICASGGCPATLV